MLAVSSAFPGYARGDVITDASVEAKILAGPHRRDVRRLGGAEPEAVKSETVEAAGPDKAPEASASEHEPAEAHDAEPAPKPEAEATKA